MILAQQVAVVEAVSPGRLILGVGPSHQPIVEGFLGLPFQRPLAHLREYVAVLRQALEQGTVDFEGEFFKVHFPRTETARVPILISALREGLVPRGGRDRGRGHLLDLPPRPTWLAWRGRRWPRERQGAGARIPSWSGTASCASTRIARRSVQMPESVLPCNPRLPFYQKMLALSGDEEAAAGSGERAL